MIIWIDFQVNLSTILRHSLLPITTDHMEISFCMHIVTNECLKRMRFLCRSNPDSPVKNNQESTQELPARKVGLLARPFGLGWRDRNKVSFHLRSLRV